MQSLEQKILKGLEWFLAIGFMIVGTLIITGSNIPLGSVYLVLALITVPVVKFPRGFRIIAILLGAFLF